MDTTEPLVATFTDSGRAGPVEWALAGMPKPGERVCGDAGLVAQAEHLVLIAVADGLGHGPLAEAAAHRALATIARTPGEPLVALASRCHRALRDTRGAAVTLVAVDTAARQVHWLGVGNVAATLLRRSPTGRAEHQHLIAAPGIVGYRLPDRLITRPHELRAGELILVSTDGVDDAFDFDDLASRSGRRMTDLATAVLGSSAKGGDDALVLVAQAHWASA